MQIDLATIVALSVIVVGISQTIKAWFKKQPWWKKPYGYIITGVVSVGACTYHVMTTSATFNLLYLIPLALAVFGEASGLYKFVKK